LELVDKSDSKSDASNSVSVRVAHRPPKLLFNFLNVFAVSLFKNIPGFTSNGEKNYKKNIIKM